VPLTLFAGVLRIQLMGTESEHIVSEQGMDGEAKMRATVGDLVEILAIGLFVAGVGAMGAALHAVA